MTDSVLVEQYNSFNEPVKVEFEEKNSTIDSFYWHSYTFLERTSYFLSIKCCKLSVP